MTEQHECEWRILLVTPNSATAQIRIRCRICNDPLLRQNAEAMLNEYETLKKATEALNWQRADAIIGALSGEFESDQEDIDAMQTYADTLEGKDGLD